MDRIFINDSQPYTQHKAIFFNQSNIIVYANKNSPYISFQKGFEIFKSKIKDIFINNHVLLVDIDLPLMPNNLCIHTVKSFLAHAEKKDIDTIL